MALSNGCGGKHLKLGLSLIGIFLAIVLAVTSYTMGTASAQDTRIREVEQKAAATDAQFDEILRRLERIERKIEKEKR